MLAEVYESQLIFTVCVFARGKHVMLDSVDLHFQ